MDCFRIALLLKVAKGVEFTTVVNLQPDMVHPPVGGFEPGVITTLEEHFPSCGISSDYSSEDYDYSSEESTEQQSFQEEPTTEHVSAIANSNCTLGRGVNILLLGATGVGKSTLGNLLLGVNKGACRQRGECLKCNHGQCKSGQCLKKEGGVCVQCKPGQCRRRRGACA